VAFAETLFSMRLIVSRKGAKTQRIEEILMHSRFAVFVLALRLRAFAWEFLERVSDNSSGFFVV
jgi:hypothetical protein